MECHDEDNAFVKLQEDASALPVEVVPHDALRQGLSALKQDAEVSHPVEAIQNNVGCPAVWGVCCTFVTSCQPSCCVVAPCC